MSEQADIASEVIDAINQATRATMEPQVVQTSGAGKAYQMVAQASALAIQDAVDSLRNAGTLADAASAAALSQLVATGEGRYVEVLTAIAQTRTEAVSIFAARTQAAVKALQTFPAG